MSADDDAGPLPECLRMRAQDTHPGREPLAADRDREHRDRHADRVRDRHEDDAPRDLAARRERGDGREDGPGARDEHETCAEADDEAARLAGDRAAGQEQERPLERTATRCERRLAARTKSITIASVRRRSSGSPSALRSAAPASVKVVNETTRPAMIAYGRQRLSLAALPASRSGSTGSTQGESAVMTPARKAIPRRTSTRREYEAKRLRGAELRADEAVGSATVEQLLTLDDAERLAEQVVAPEAWSYIVGGAGDERTLRWNREAFSRYRLQAPRPRRRLHGLDRDDRARHAVSRCRCSSRRWPSSRSRTRRASSRWRAARPRPRRSCASRPSPPRRRPTSPRPPPARRAGSRSTCSATARCQRRGHRAGARVRLLGARPDGRPARVRHPASRGTTRIRGAGGRRAGDRRCACSEAEAPTEHHSLELLESGLEWDYVTELRERWNVPVVVKGLVTAEDADLACQHGAAGVVVSNHGGRQLDGAIASLEALPEVVEAVGDRAEVYLDGGVRRGTDVVMALALGARAVLVGRPAMYGLAFGGDKGVAQVLEILREETENALALLGCRSPAEVTAAHVKPA